MSDFLASQKLAHLRRRLDALHYSGPLSKSELTQAIESASLVEKLLSDVVKCNSNIEALSKTIAEQRAHLERHQHSLAPLKEENERITKENNSLHFQVIQVKEGRDEALLGLRKRIAATEESINDLKFVISQKDIKARQLEEENLGLKERIEELLAKLKDPRSAEIARKQKISMTRPITSSGFISSVHPQVQQETIQELERTYVELNRIRKMNLSLRHSQDEMKSEVEKWREKVDTRENEIKRLGRLFEGGQHLDQLKVEYVSNCNSKTIAKLQHQMDFLNRENHRLENEVQEARLFVRESRPGFRADNSAAVLQLEIKEQRQAIAALKNALMFRNQEIQDLKRQIKPDPRVTMLEGELTQMKQHIAKLAGQNAQRNALASALQSNERVCAESVTRHKQELGEKQALIQNLEEELTRIKEELSTRTNELNLQQGKCHHLEKQLIKFKENKENMEQSFERKIDPDKTKKMNS